MITNYEQDYNAKHVLLTHILMSNYNLHVMYVILVHIKFNVKMIIDTHK